MAESKEKLKSLLIKVKEETQNVGLKDNIKKAKIMAIWFHHFMANRSGKYRSSDILFWGPPK